MTTWHNSPLLSVPVHAPGPDAPWSEVAAGMTRSGNACVHTTWREWPAEPGSPAALRILLGRDWARYRDTADATARHRFVASRLAIRYTAAAALGCGPAELDLSYKPGGRPYLRGFDQIDLSLTHTDDLIAVGISRNGRIGVDTEPADRRLSFELLQDQVCTPAERAELAVLGERGRNAGMLRLWTLKEAYTKALGLGLRMGFVEFGFATATSGETGLLTPDGSPATHGEWAFGTYPVAGRYLLSVACHDAGLDTSRDSAVATMLDEGFVGMVSALLDPA